MVLSKLFFAPVRFGLWALLLMGCSAAAQDAPHALLVIEGETAGPVTAPVNFTEVARALGIAEPLSPERIVAAAPGADGTLTPLLAQFDPAEDFDAATRAEGTLSVQGRPANAAGEVQVYFTADRPELPPPPQAGALAVQVENGRITVRNDFFALTHDPAKMGGLPSRIEFVGSGKVFDTYVLNDRVHQSELGGFHLRNDPQPEVTVLAAGPVRAVVQVRARYMRGDAQPESQPEATYTFAYYAGSPLVHVTAQIRQQQAFTWPELHFIELNFPDESFTHWAGGEPFQEEAFDADKKSSRGGTWGALVDGENLFGWLGGVTFYDGRGEYGAYLHGPWVTWSGTEIAFVGSFWIGTSPDGARAVQRAAASRQGTVRAYLSVPPLRARLARLREQVAQLPRGPRRGRFVWALAETEKQAHARGELTTAGELAARLEQALTEGREAATAVPWFALRETGLTFFSSDRIGIGLDLREDGLALASLFDLHAEKELLSANGSLWSLQLRGPEGETWEVDNTAGWRQVEIVPPPGDQDGAVALELRWREPAEPQLAGLAVTCPVRLGGGQAAFRLQVDNPRETVGLSHIRFPQIAAGQIGATAEDDVAIFPRGSGERADAPLLRGVDYSSDYPNGWSTMQFMAHYDTDSGLYVGMHDPQASTKQIAVTHPAGTDFVRFTYDFPAPEMGQPGNNFVTPGPAVLEVFTGDWFDAARLYQDWARAEAPWWPREGRVGRETPEWFADVAVWALGGGAPQDCVPAVKAFAEYMGVPTAFHWYNWHVIPFDDNYPHYFPAKDGFAEGVRELQQAGVRVMPYINGRLWDTDTEDFPTQARPAATKNEQGEPYIEEYGSGAKLAPMCPTTALWQETVQDIVLRLQNEMGVDGVYIDQVAAAGPRLCFDATHGHPLGGGHWWTVDGYWPLLTALRQQMNPDKFLTSECNAEPYLHLFDGYLTWHWQFDQQIPLFSAVYGGQLQLFSRAYRGGETKDLALRMKAAQQLVFGEQLGWLDPNVIQEEQNASFLRQMARLRYALRDYLARGEMARPPLLHGDVPTVTADWQWSGEWIVTNPALETGAWRARDGRLAVLFVNVSDEELRVEWEFAGERYGMGERHGVRSLLVTPRTEEGPGETTQRPASFRQEVVVPGRKAVVWEVKGR